MSDRKDRTSISGEWKQAESATIQPRIISNQLFDEVISVLGVDIAAFAVILSNVLKTIGSTPSTVVLEDVGNLMPEIERRVRQLVPPENATVAMKRLRSFLINSA